MENTNQPSNQIVIKAKTEYAETAVFHVFTSPILAEQAFYAFSHDEEYQNLYWQMWCDGEMIDWHKPKGFKEMRPID